MSLATAPTIVEPAYFERLARAEFAHWWPAGMWKIASHWLDRSLRGRRGLLAVDVGCGTGGAAARLRRRPEIGRVIALDASETALDHARGYALPLVRGDAFRLPFGDGSVDVATCFDVWQHLPPGEARGAAAELARILRPGGVVVVRANGRGLWPDRRELRGDPILFRPRMLAEALAGAGLVVLASTYANCLPSVAQEVVGRFRPRPSPLSPAHPAGGGLCLRLPPPGINRAMGMLSATEAFWAGRLGLGLPIGHSTMALAVRAERSPSDRESIIPRSHAPRGNDSSTALRFPGRTTRGVG